MGFNKLPVQEEVGDSCEILCDLNQGTDFDGDNVILWQEGYEVSKEILRQIVFMTSVDGNIWKDYVQIGGIETTTFSSGNNDVRAKAGCCLPPGSHLKREDLPVFLS